MPIVQGVPGDYVDPPLGGGLIAIGATPARELLTANMTERQLLAAIGQLLAAILLETRLQNQLLFPNVNFENERAALDDPFTELSSELINR